MIKSNAAIKIMLPTTDFILNLMHHPIPNALIVLLNANIFIILYGFCPIAYAGAYAPTYVCALDDAYACVYTFLASWYL